MRLPRAYAAMAAIYTLESRDAAYFPIEPTSVPQAGGAHRRSSSPSWRRKNAAQLTRPEFRQLSVVRFSPTQVAANMPIDQAELQKRFNFRKDTLSSPETRTIIQIPAKDAAAAQRVAQDLAKGTDPAAAARAPAPRPSPMRTSRRPRSPTPRWPAAAFATPSGQVATVKGDLGFAVVKVLAVAPGRAVTLEEVRPALEAEIRKGPGLGEVYALTQAYDDAHQGGANLTASAAKAGVPVATLGPLTQTGRDQTGQPVPGLSQKLMQTAWSPARRWRERGRGRRQRRVLRRARGKGDRARHPAFEEIRPMLTRPGPSAS